MYSDNVINVHTYFTTCTDRGIPCFASTTPYTITATVYFAVLAVAGAIKISSTWLTHE